MNIRWKLIVLGMEPARNRTHWAACFQVNCRSDLGAASCHVGNSCQQLRCRVLPLHLWLIFPCLSVSSSPEAADSSSFDVQLGDIILTATDGLFDNMPDYMILQELKKLKVSLLEYPLIHAFTRTASSCKWTYFMSFKCKGFPIF